MSNLNDIFLSKNKIQKLTTDLFKNINKNLTVDDKKIYVRALVNNMRGVYDKLDKNKVNNTTLPKIIDSFDNLVLTTTINSIKEDITANTRKISYPQRPEAELNKDNSRLNQLSLVRDREIYDKPQNGYQQNPSNQPHQRNPREESNNNQLERQFTTPQQQAQIQQVDSDRFGNINSRHTNDADPVERFENAKKSRESEVPMRGNVKPPEIDFRLPFENKKGKQVTPPKQQQQVQYEQPREENIYMKNPGNSLMNSGYSDNMTNGTANNNLMGVGDVTGAGFDAQLGDLNSLTNFNSKLTDVNMSIDESISTAQRYEMMKNEREIVNNKIGFKSDPVPVLNRQNQQHMNQQPPRQQQHNVNDTTVYRNVPQQQMPQQYNQAPQQIQSQYMQPHNTYQQQPAHIVNQPQHAEHDTGHPDERQFMQDQYIKQNMNQQIPRNKIEIDRPNNQYIDQMEQQQYIQYMQSQNKPQYVQSSQHAQQMQPQQHVQQMQPQQVPSQYVQPDNIQYVEQPDPNYNNNQYIDPNDPITQSLLQSHAQIDELHRNIATLMKELDGYKTSNSILVGKMDEIHSNIVNGKKADMANFSDKKTEIDKELTKMASKQQEFDRQNTQIKELINSNTQLLGDKHTIIVDSRNLDDKTMRHSLKRVLNNLSGVKLKKCFVSCHTFNVMPNNCLIYFAIDDDFQTVALQSGNYTITVLLERINLLLQLFDICVMLDDTTNQVIFKHVKNTNFKLANLENSLLYNLGFTSANYKDTAIYTGEQSYDLTKEKLLNIYLRNLNTTAPFFKVLDNTSIEQLADLNMIVTELKYLEIDIKTAKNMNMYIDNNIFYYILELEITTSSKKIQ
ncbi:MAG: hypothetical protein Faunusvirus23_3 [Faunusvirus sp.]|jgi:hypothetical protein|uniref:Uncharacterized protein n=1 Tax=Faunusvirus sp. TaxID=2487766 RepID=A0A3G4ZXD7_9VIRU|nr:MAG: hypothetical protein Faunusvirus23_3 [Faunusvirus sp.]